MHILNEPLRSWITYLIICLFGGAWKSMLFFNTWMHAKLRKIFLFVPINFETINRTVHYLNFELILKNNSTDLRKKILFWHAQLCFLFNPLNSRRIWQIDKNKSNQLKNMKIIFISLLLLIFLHSFVELNIQKAKHQAIKHSTKLAEKNFKTKPAPNHSSKIQNSLL